MSKFVDLIKLHVNQYFLSWYVILFEACASFLSKIFSIMCRHHWNTLLRKYNRAHAVSSKNFSPFKKASRDRYFSLFLTAKNSPLYYLICDAQLYMGHFITLSVTPSCTWATLLPYLWRPVVHGPLYYLICDAQLYMGHFITLSVTPSCTWATLLPYLWRPVVHGPLYYLICDAQLYMGHFITLSVTPSCTWATLLPYLWRPVVHGPLYYLICDAQLYSDVNSTPHSVLLVSWFGPPRTIDGLCGKKT